MNETDVPVVVCRCVASEYQLPAEADRVIDTELIVMHGLPQASSISTVTATVDWPEAIELGRFLNANFEGVSVCIEMVLLVLVIELSALSLTVIVGCGVIVAFASFTPVKV